MCHKHTQRCQLRQLKLDKHYRFYLLFFLLFSAVRERRGLFFGKNDQTTTRTVLKSPLGFVSVSVAGGKKAPEDPCNPSQNSQQTTGRKPLINIKIPTLFNRGGNQATTPPPECTTVEVSPTTHSPPPIPSTSVPIETPVPKPIPSSPLPPKPSTAVPSPSISTVDPDDELINSIFGEESAPTTAANKANNGAGLIDFRRPIS